MTVRDLVIVPAVLGDNVVKKHRITVTLGENLTQRLNSKCKEFFRTPRKPKVALFMYLFIPRK